MAAQKKKKAIKHGSMEVQAHKTKMAACAKQKCNAYVAQKKKPQW